jgi:hypothetical protein
MRIIRAIIIGLFLSSHVWAFDYKDAALKPVDPAAIKVLEKLAGNLRLTEVELFDARKSGLIEGFWSLSFSSSEAERIILFTNGDLAVPVVQQLRGDSSGNAVFRGWQGLFVGDVHPDPSWAYLLKKGTASGHDVVIVDNLWTETAADFIDWFEGKRKECPYGDLEIDSRASVYFVPSFSVFSKMDSDLSKHFYALVDGKFFPEKYVVMALSRMDQAYKHDPGLLMHQVLAFVGPKQKDDYVRMVKNGNLEKLQRRTRESYKKMGMGLPKYLVADGRFFMRLEDL